MRHCTWLWLRDGVDQGEYDHVRAAAATYERIRLAFCDALRHERHRCELLQRMMRAAGLPATSCFGPNSPLVRWRAVWVETGVCDDNASLTQNLLPDQPMTPLLPAGGLAARRLCVRIECAPPTVIPPTTTQVYVAASADGAGFGLTLVRGGDAEYDHTAIHVADASGRAPDPHTATSACLFAATAALELLATPCISSLGRSVPGLIPCINFADAPQLPSKIFHFTRT